VGKPTREQQLESEIENIRTVLHEAQETLNAIRSGTVDALVVLGPGGEQVYTLTGAQEPYRIMVETMNEGAATYSADGIILYCNRRFAELLRTPLEQVIGSSLKFLVVEEAREKFDRDLAQSLQGFLRGEVDLQASDGTILHLQYSTSPLKNHDVQGVIAVFTDVSEILSAKDVAVEALNVKTRALIELQVARDEAIAAKEIAESALAAKSQFLSTLSHEVRTPMAGVIGLVELIFVSAQSDDMRKLASVALQACKRLLQMLNDLLDASKLQAGAVTLEKRFFSVRPVIGDLVQLTMAEATKKGIEVVPTVMVDVPEIVCGDELRLRQVLQNLVFNAVKFTDNGRVTVQVELVNKTATMTTLKFSVTDTGIGISAEQQERIFEPFTQGHDSTTRIYGGTGLGLNIARTCVHLMDGEIGVTSKVGSGSTFWIVLSFRDDLCSTA